ncbi:MULTISPECIES: sensor histidine kinase [unclassified Brevundimonas]|nr:MULTISPECIES: HAMP domain-containing sensor histidine kinase [unclassified Brevundimonas]
MKSSSLGWRLIRRVVLIHVVLAALMTAVVLTGLAISGIVVDEASAEQIVAIEKAIHVDANGRLALRETRAVAAMKATRDFWFVLRDADGRELRHGVLPAEYPALEARIGELEFAHRISYWTDPDRRFPSARMLKTEVDGRPAALIIGVGQKLTVWQSLRGSLVVFAVYGLPLTILMALGAAPLIVLAVRRTLAPLEVVLDEASRIDVRSPGVRLSEGRLPREIAPLIAAVNSALDRLEEGYASQARFMTDAAHELRTPVAILQTRIESLSAGMDRTALTQDVTRLALLCEQLLDLQRINQGVGQRTAVDLGQLARQCAADLAPLAISANREIGLELIGSSVVAGDGPALGRALSNLIMNALQHGDGPITVTVKGGTMSVADEGQGIRPEARRKVFEPFHRLKPRSTGSGLGLALVKEIAQLHGGTVSIGEGPRGGADVSIHLPLAVRQTTA